MPGDFFTANFIFIFFFKIQLLYTYETHHIGSISFVQKTKQNKKIEENKLNGRFGECFFFTSKDQTTLSPNVL